MEKGLNGAKSAEFGCFWKSFFMTALCYPLKIDMENKTHLKKLKTFRTYFNNISYVLPCKFCSIFTREVLMKRFPLNFSGRVELMFSLYLWKDQVNKKLIKQGCTFTKPSPSFRSVLKKYEALRAKCDKKVGKCV